MTPNATCSLATVLVIVFLALPATISIKASQIDQQLETLQATITKN
jgi:hypothetical protein